MSSVTTAGVPMSVDARAATASRGRSLFLSSRAAPPPDDQKRGICHTPPPKKGALCQSRDWTFCTAITSSTAIGPECLQLSVLPAKLFQVAAARCQLGLQLLCHLVGGSWQYS